MTNPPTPSPAPASEAETPALDWICTKCRRVGRAADLTHAQACHDLLYPPCGYCVGPLTPPRCTCRDFQSFGECSHVLAAPTPESPREAGTPCSYAGPGVCPYCFPAAPTTEGPRAEDDSDPNGYGGDPSAASRPGAPEGTTDPDVAFIHEVVRCAYGDERVEADKERFLAIADRLTRLANRVTVEQESAWEYEQQVDALTSEVARLTRLAVGYCSTPGAPHNTRHVITDDCCGFYLSAPTDPLCKCCTPPSLQRIHDAASPAGSPTTKTESA